MATTNTPIGDDFQDFVRDLIQQVHFEGPAKGIAAKVADEGLGGLSAKQRYVFDREIMDVYTRDCVRSCEMPWSEMLESNYNGGHCSYCAKMYSSLMKE